MVIIIMVRWIDKILDLCSCLLYQPLIVSEKTLFTFIHDWLCSQVDGNIHQVLVHHSQTCWNNCFSLEMSVWFLSFIIAAGEKGQSDELWRRCMNQCWKWKIKDFLPWLCHEYLNLVIVCWNSKNISFYYEEIETNIVCLCNKKD